MNKSIVANCKPDYDKFDEVLTAVKFGETPMLPNLKCGTYTLAQVREIKKWLNPYKMQSVRWFESMVLLKLSPEDYMEYRVNGK